MSARRVFVTGGAGFIGSHTCKALAASGFEPVVYDNLSTGHRKSVRWGPLVEGDLLDPDRLTDALRVLPAAAVIHFAASAYVGEASRIRANTPEQCGRIAVAHRSLPGGRGSNVIFSSTCATYGVP